MNKLRFYRTEQGLAQHVLAKRVGIMQSAIANYESGSREPRIEIAMKIYKELKKGNEKVTFQELWGL